ncbi:hypothetical protein [Arthrobacter sp. NPDC090010]|uniref:hypothetical protein n=1 Tax=Arthrobacter sp. NPDC090010 TaxID=3363942 RepID=UPI0037F1F029
MNEKKPLSPKKKLGLGLAAGAVTVISLGGFASAAYAASPTPASETTTATTSDGGHHRGGFEGGLAKQLAAKLSVSETKVADALKAFREANKPTDTKQQEASKTPEQRQADQQAREKALTASLAKSLGLDESKVSAALTAVRSDAKTERTAELKSRLDQAVKDGKLSSSEESAVLKAQNLGLLGGR